MEEQYVTLTNSLKVLRCTVRPRLNSTIDIAELSGIRSVALKDESNPNNGFESLADEYEHLYIRMLRNTANVGGEDAIPVCTDASTKLANIYRLRKSILEHHVQELQDTNASLPEDVEWHVQATTKLEDALGGAQIEKAAAFKEMMSLDT